LQLGIKAGGNSSLKESNLENSVKKVKNMKVKTIQKLLQHYL